MGEGADELLQGMEMGKGKFRVLGIVRIGSHTVQDYILVGHI